MAVIKPTFTLVSNAYTASSDPGPTHNLTQDYGIDFKITDTLTVDSIETKLVTVSATHAVLWDASELVTAPATAGTDGGFVYLNNQHATVSVYIGFGTSAALETDNNTTRLLTLKPGEFAWLPWDLTADLIVDASDDGTDALETWYFDRG